MRNPQAQWRIEYARRLAEQLAARAGVRAVVVAGSVARGYADEYSDVEIPVFWETAPGDEARTSIADALGGRFLFAYDGPSREDQLLVDGVQVDLWHIAVEDQQAVIHAVLQDFRSDMESLNAMDTIRCCIPLYGEEVVRPWKERAREYPDGLARKVIGEHLASFRVDRLAVCADRGDPTGFFSQLTLLQREAFLVLLALNRCYFPAFKWIYPSLAAMAVKPRSIGDRFRRGYASPHAEAVADMQRILSETLRLVEERFPQIDTEAARRRLGYRRRAAGGPQSR